MLLRMGVSVKGDLSQWYILAWGTGEQAFEQFWIWGKIE